MFAIGRSHQIQVLFVCMGNICRSPTAEGVFAAMVKQAGLADQVAVDSAGTGGWHVGNAPDSRAMAAAAKRGYDLSTQKARQVIPDDLVTFDYVLAMDSDNLQNLRRLAGDQEPLTTPALFLEEFGSGKETEVPDPYYGGEQGFEIVLDLVEDASRNLLDDIRKRLSK